MQYYSMDGACFGRGGLCASTDLCSHSGFQKSQDINGRYLDGIALTTNRGQGREHVWSYAIGIADKANRTSRL